MAKDRVIMGRVFGLMLNAVFERDVVGLTKELGKRMGLPKN